MEVLISNDCSNDEKEYIVSKLVEYNLKNVPTDEQNLFEPLKLILKDENERIIGGILGEFPGWHRLNINIFWIDEKYREFGWGTKMLQEAEKIAREKGCKIILLDTYSFQAPGFYIKNGYEIYATLDNCPVGHKKHYLKKLL